MMVYLTTWISLFALEVLAVAGQRQPAEQIVITPSEPHQLDPDVSKVQHELKKAEIFPTVIDKFLPSFLLDATWPSGERAELGNTMKVDDVQDNPTITVRQSHSSLSSSSSNEKRPGITYTITITDPDAPSRDNPEWSEFCHLIATGLDISSSSPSSESTTTSLRPSSLNYIMPYKPPGPPPKTGKHRYVFLLFAPANGTTDPLHPTKPEDRKHWGTGKARHGVRDWAEENGLKPVAANFIYAQNEEQ
ncbi:PEBP-like protein [Daldinia caldariorum]|uniref:PEBP-like protein n=1 Tax=Daldinia caldariorum TaxID=326644 RepID=UPI00200888B2|nr:PEBP-like protein [Daldinia caldariorum]KAI1467471.1 PEBP-like protein [Daldinia caldariorum]